MGEEFECGESGENPPSLDPHHVRHATQVLYLSFGALAAVPLLVAALTFYLLYWSPTARIAAARSWIETPCEILQVEMKDRGLDVLYEYEFEGQKYESTRYDLTIGQSGEDDWARDAYVRLRKNPSTVCFVNPKNPAEAVLDRERRHPAIALVLPAIFAAVGLAFLGKLLFGMGRIRAAARLLTRDHETDESRTESLATLSQPRSPAWPWFAWTMAFGFFAGLFVVMDGIEFVRSLRYGAVQWLPAEGTVDWRRNSGISTAFGRVKEFQVRYQVHGTEYKSRCYAVKTPRPYAIEYDAKRPWRGRLVGTTLHATPRALLALPIGMAGLLLVGLAASGCRRMFGSPSRRSVE